MSNIKYYLTTSPGRINIIGEHTDHQKGLVMPTAINLQIFIYVSNRTDDLIRVFSETLNEYDEFPISNISKSYGWKNYIRGTIDKFNRNFGLEFGFDIFISSRLPFGAGLSSSASLVVGLYSSLEYILNKQINDMKVIEDCWEVENNYVGLSCGIMDQFIVRLGKENSALKLNCENLEYYFINLPSEIKFLIIDTGVRRNLKDSPYNKRIEECNYSLKFLKKKGYNIENLSQIKIADLGYIQKILVNPYYKRVEHIVSENHRVNLFDLKITKSKIEAGKFLYESHLSLEKSFEASWIEADQLVQYSKSISGVYGARMVGGGWGGSVLFMIDTEKAYKVKNNLRKYLLEKGLNNHRVLEIASSGGVKTQKLEKTSIPMNFKKFLLNET
ncbi:MAG: Galactokinase [Candidatus Heimdallarchaeota archaeon LC_3]|nr:MAG: Galactokinase [Candidatus Heimdallarchaeota archaeon LC_3]